MSIECWLNLNTITYWAASSQKGKDYSIHLGCAYVEKYLLSLGQEWWWGGTLVILRTTQKIQRLNVKTETVKFSWGSELYNCPVFSVLPAEEAMWAVAVFLWSLLCNYSVIVWQWNSLGSSKRTQSSLVSNLTNSKKSGFCFILKCHFFPLAVFHLSAFYVPTLPLTFVPTKPEGQVQVENYN